ncbi:hypothetical protein OAK92_02290 [Crocinitomicaceae bacterium]|nr:hypothetical protein [Crocinitomicaceae bacterium]
MKVHLIRSEGFKMEDYNHVFNILNQYSGGITFVPSEPIVLPDTDIEITYEDKDQYERQALYSPRGAFFEKRSFPITEKSYTEEELLSVCNKFRKENNISDSEQVLLLTEKKNVSNWFGGVDQTTLNNFFIDCSDWDYYFNGFDIRFPIAFSIAAWLMRKVIFTSAKEGFSALHKKPRGCIMDYCIDKKEIQLQMRTADICDACLSYSEKNDANRVHMNQLIQIMEGVRSNLLFRDRSKYLRTNSRLEFRGMMHKMYLTDLGDLQVNLNPKERALYLVFINHPEGISRRDLVDYKIELLAYYDFFCSKWDKLADKFDENKKSERDNKIEESLNLLTHPHEDNFMQVLSRIRRKFIDTVGEDQSKTYSIESYDGKYKILLDRELVSFDEDAKLTDGNIY